ncbi:MAG: DUF4294 domain-containing protein [Paludibacteraceae bacterium]|nr:DUF4294 domain-containing protein [Paludibacteraceae bacterium]MBP6284259.1 DUF4294 domain-containing protein [Paludibacteraceae bacterium]
MKQTLLLIALLGTIGIAPHRALAMPEAKTAQGYVLNGVIDGKDTIALVILKDHIVFPRYTKKKDVKRYDKLVRDLKKVYPFAKMVGREVERVNPLLLKIEDKKERKEYMRAYEKALFKEYEPVLKKFTFSQGKLLIKLIDRECEQSSYELIREYRGGLTAFFWQGFARILGANLKEDFNDNNTEDAMINRIIILIEAGQL